MSLRGSRCSTRGWVDQPLLDLRSRELAEATRVDDFIVSEHLISLMMAQLSENPELFGVFTDIFDPEGAEIYLKPVGDYVATGEPVSFYTVVEAAPVGARPPLAIASPPRRTMPASRRRPYEPEEVYTS